ncbi:MAG TPA: MerR family transcriptional regulator [Acidimicrobiales bacterium]
MVDLINIGEFARQTRLSPKALRLYDELGLLLPARVDTANGYRFYAVEQIEPARLVAALRQLDMPLSEIKAVAGMEANGAARAIADYWSASEDHHLARRELAAYLVERLQGKEIAVEVTMHSLPARHLLCLKRQAPDEAAVWKLGKDFIAIMRERPMPRLGGHDGAAFLIYYGEVNADSDGPVEWCQPIEADNLEVVAASYPELQGRDEAAHDEARVHMGTGDSQLSPAFWAQAGQSLQDWARDLGRLPLGVRIVYEWPSPGATDQGPDCSFAMPLASTLS